MPLPATLSCVLRLPRLFGLLFLLFVGSTAAGQAQQLVFDLAYPGGDTRNSGESWLGALTTDAQGNVYVGGYFAGSLYFGSQQLVSHVSHFDIFVAKYSADGDLQWVQQAGLNGDERVRGLVVDAAGNVYVSGTYVGTTQFGALAPLPNAGSTDEDAFVAKLDAAGTWQWAVGAGGSGPDLANALALGPSGQLVVAGSFGSPAISFGATQLLNSQPTAPGLDIFVARLTAAGTWLSATQAGGPGNDTLYGLAVDAAGAAYVCGDFAGAQTQFGALTLTNAATSGTRDGFVAQLSAAGSWQWANRLGGPNQDYLMAVALDGSGRPYVTGSFSSSTLVLGTTTLTSAGASDVVVAALDAAGNWRWASRAGGSDGELGWDLVVLPTGQVTVAGQFDSRQLPVGSATLPNSSAVGNGEAFLARLDAAGTWLTGLAPVGTGEKDARRLAIAANGTTYLAGIYWGTQAAFGEFNLPGNIFFPNCYVAHVAETGTLAQLSSVAPSLAAAGQTVTITGSNFVNVRAVRFNGLAATSYAVASPTRLTAVVPAGTTSGPLRVRTDAGTSAGAAFTSAGPLATAAASAAEPAQVWPNPVAESASLHVQLPPQLPLAGPTRAMLYNSVGQLLTQTDFSGSTLDWPLRLPAGLYHLTLWPAGQPAWHRSLTVGE